MKRNVLMDGNGSDTVMIEGLGLYVPMSQVRSLQAEVQRLCTANLDSVAVCEQALQAKAAAEQERDQLNAHVQRIDTLAWKFLTYPKEAQTLEDLNRALSNSPSTSLTQHDAEVIQRFKKSALETAGLSAGCVQLAAPEEVHRTWVQFADHYIDQLHQQAKSQPGNYSCELECGAHGTYCRCRAEAEQAKEVQS